MFQKKTPKSQADKEHQLAVFISYSHHDIVAADQIVASLESNGFNVLIDRRDLPYGEKWQNELSGFIASSDTVIWLVSPTSIISKWCNWELDEVNKHNKRLVPVRVGDVTPEDLPRQLGEIHILPARDLFDVSAHMSVLATTLETDRPWLKEHSRLSERARQWIKRNKTEASLLRGRALNDAEKWQNAQPPKAPAPSHDVFNLILSSRQATIKRHRRMVTGSVTGMVARTGPRWRGAVAMGSGKETIAARYQGKFAVWMAGLRKTQGSLPGHERIYGRGRPAGTLLSYPRRL